MKAETKKQVTVTLDEYEATWLKGVMQNPLHCENPSDEDIENRSMRISLFQVLRLELDK